MTEEILLEGPETTYVNFPVRGVQESGMKSLIKPNTKMKNDKLVKGLKKSINCFCSKGYKG